MFLGRWSMAQGWAELLGSKLRRKNEFVSADARRFSDDPRTYEMLGGTGPHQLNVPPPDRVLTSPTPPRPVFSPTPPADSKQEYFTPARAYVNPVSSYSYPRPPSQHKDWDPRSTHARSNSKGYDLNIYPG
jgi:hypothetical protein